MTSELRNPQRQDTTDIAKRLAQRGVFVFPVIPNGKTPAIPGWQVKATIDHPSIDKAWRAGDGIGVATGPSRLLVIDVDVKKGKGGDDTLAALCLEHDDLPDTFSVRTPSGGRHQYFRLPEGRDAASSVQRLGPGLDVRASGGYVVGPGTVIDGQSYEVCRDAPIAVAPDWLVDLAGKPRERQEGGTEPVSPMDQPSAILRARAWLRDQADEAIEGAGGNITTYRVAARLKDFGLSELVALELMGEDGGWNDTKASPPWDWSDLATVIGNAYRYGNNPPGVSNPAADFDPIPSAEADEPGGADEEDGLDWTPVDGDDCRDLPPRDWILGRLLLGGYVTQIIAPPGVGKSTLGVAIAHAVTTGRDDILRMPVRKPGTVYIINLEDDRDEMRRRLAAAALHFAIDPVSRAGRQIRVWRDDRRFRVAERSNATGAIKRSKDADELVRRLKEVGAAVGIVDPFVETHPGSENDNGEMASVLAIYRDIARETGVAMLIVHHSRKLPQASAEGHQGSLETGRGASAIGGSVRVAATMFDMSAKEAETYGITEEERFRYVRLDDAKGNYALKSGRATWFRKVEVVLGNGDRVGVLEPCDLVAKAVGDKGQLAKELVALVGQDPEKTEMSLYQATKWAAENSMVFRGSGAGTSSVRRRIEEWFGDSYDCGVAKIAILEGEPKRLSVRIAETSSTEIQE